MPMKASSDHGFADSSSGWSTFAIVGASRISFILSYFIMFII